MWFPQGIFVVYMCWFLSTLTLFLSSLVMKKKSIKNNSEPALVMGCALVSEGKAYTECHVINESLV